MKDGRLDTHTYSLLLAAQDDSLKIKGLFTTIATGKDAQATAIVLLIPRKALLEGVPNNASRLKATG